MIHGMRLKVCGLTSLGDAEAAAAVGVDFLGFIFHAASPRRMAREQFRAMAGRLPPRQKVAVCAEPTVADLAEFDRLGFDCFQVHFRHDTPLPDLAAWSQFAGHGRLWLAPKLPPATGFKAEWLPLANTFLMDTFHPDKFGGTGVTGDWAGFRRLRESHPEKTWILSGGLKPETIAAAVAATGANFLDVNSGVELSPGVKDPAKLKALVQALG
ncbi:MAG TPA: phosphoribosylanthranilate isomerase [Lacunisphaera sp.]|jgi:phosphoribosylanthranilate isomerase|nr:phosphoribosylanthranilate isomerase [Lacunisphaera sp.]